MNYSLIGNANGVSEALLRSFCYEWKLSFGSISCLIIRYGLLYAMMSARTGGPACFLIGNVLERIEMKPASPAKEHYAYSKHGSCTVLAAIEPKTGQRLAHVRRHRTKVEFTKFMQHLAQTYSDAEKITLILDNLNTHTPNAFYEVLEAEKAEKLANRFDFVYTPKAASWLNMIELEFSDLSRQCLNRRIPSINQLTKEVMCYFKQGRLCGTNG